MQIYRKAWIDKLGWDFLERSEYIDPWNDTCDPFEIANIKSHRKSPTKLGEMELLVEYHSDKEED